MSKLSKQGVFNLVYNHYANGGEVGWNKDYNSCAYFSGEGRCAVGVILDHLGVTLGDLEDDEHEEGTRNLEADAKDIVEFLGDKLTDQLEDDVYYFTHKRGGFLTELQKAHDYVADDEGSIGVVNNLKTFAQEQELTVPD